MGKRLLFGVVVLAVVAMPTARPEAAPARAATASTKLEVATVNGESTLRAEAAGVSFRKRVGRDRVVMRLEVPRDRIDVEVNIDGRVRVVRNGKALALLMKPEPARAMARVQKLTAGSSALARFKALVAGLAGDNRPEAQSLRVSHALLEALRGNSAPAMAFAGRPARSDGALVRAMSRGVGEGPYACWAEYSTTMYQYLVQLNDCVAQYWWIPGWTAACGAQYALQGELAWFWLISCSGGMPV